MRGSLQEHLEDFAKAALRDRLQTWLKYEFDKQWLPQLLEDVTKRVRVELMTNANVPEEIKLRIRFVKTEAD